ncbi:serine acetyltransferase [Metabacillus herbersteinensis]|uniref:Serine acetyltransferase n=1 Tax=Metabacillus herbersteinensis TaxID=283816 RepID=A0ABV6GD50_9BACI
MLDLILLKLFGGVWTLKKRCLKSNSRFLIKLYNILLENRGCFIGYTAKLDGSLILPHGLNGIFISGASSIGKNCVIFHQVTIGSNTLVDSKGLGAPSIGNNCYIGAGAKIIGDVTVGNNVRVGANCVVFQDIPDNSVVVAQPSKVIRKENINNRYYTKGTSGWGFLQDGQWVLEDDLEVIKTLTKGVI